MAKSKTSLRLLVATGVLSLLPLSGLWLWKGRGPLGAQATVIVKRGATVDAMADQLERDGVIRSAALFKLWARARRLDLIRGEYTFSPRASLSDVANKLRRGDIHYTAITIPPGSHAWAVQHRFRDFIPEDVFWTLWKSPRLANAAGFPDAENLEGLVAPATYRVNHALEPEEIFLMLAEHFRDKVRPSLDGGVLPPYQTLILASMVEKETEVPEERARVAGVYLKRLRMGMRLQCDPTALYARWQGGDLRFTGPTPEDVHRPSRFNTYTVAGLPPTPIASPDPAAIEAARAPQLGTDLYFVATGKGGHNFAPDLSQHNQNVSAYRRELARQRKTRG
jgi:UPF0755 protein